MSLYEIDFGPARCTGLAGCQGGALTEFYKDEPNRFGNFYCGALPHTLQKAGGLLKPYCG